MKQNDPQQNRQDKAKVLIALAAQESEPTGQPPSPEELTDFFENSKRFSKQRQEEILAYLDSNPQAYDRWIKQGKAAERPSRVPSTYSIMPYALAACLAVVVLGISFFWRDQSFQLDQAIDRSYRSATLRGSDVSFELAVTALNDTLLSSEQPLGFSQPGQLSNLGQGFMLGLQQKDRKSYKILPSDVHPEDYQLGRWHTLLWTVSQQKEIMPVEFWQEQLTILAYFQTHYSKLSQELSTPEVQTVTLQLERAQPALQTLAENNQATQTYQKIEQILAALRYSLIPAL